MKKNVFDSFCTGLLIFFLGVQSVLAHGDDPRLEISAEYLNPGSELELRGVDFEFETEISLSLMSSQAELPLGIVTADTGGIFLFTIALPVDLAEGTYFVRATTGDHTVDSPSIKVSGIAVEDGGQDRLDEETGYGLLAPMPTPVVGVATTVPPAALPSEPVAAQRSPAWMGWIAAAAGVVVVVSFLSRKKQ